MAFPKIDGYVVTEKLGSGSYSTVYKAYTKVGAKSVVAIKCVDKSSVKHSGSAVDNLITEIRLLKTLTHPHIVLMKDFTWDDKNIYIIMEYCCGGDLSKYIHRYGRVPEKQVLYFLQQLTSALKFMREKGVVHMDLKPHNLLLHKNTEGKYILKVADFGFAQYMLSSESRAQCVRGSPLYMAPEMATGTLTDARVDLWSLGVIMYECLFGRAPYSSNTLRELMAKIRDRTPIELPPNSCISAGCRDLLTRLLKHEPDERITFEELFSHPYLDLEHMPSKWNYEKAVGLIRKAIENDCKGRLEEAFPLYCESLRYLVPAVGAETDRMRKSALTAKLTRYMERAEEIKQILQGNTTVSDQSEANTTSRTDEIEPQAEDQNGKTSSEIIDEQTDEQTDDGQKIDLTESPQCSYSSKTNDRWRSRFALKRLFSKNNSSVPFLDSNDAVNLSEEKDTEKDNLKYNENDACKIT